MTKNRPELFVQQVDRGGFKPIWPISSNRAPPRRRHLAPLTYQSKLTLSIEAVCV